ncbi:LysR family transcriptional regulator [Thalassotalea euphylliae]|uniref:LysR family transcriptional regulator n=1 Tax=Thalassotalea euphylliae TaxID=1655234 RepID=A0A3E0TTV4_9GAMM|nr:LysR family transcriptional regulator [Thalassotalea euphylliae]REL28106.1 LysR family transcriptional regulator [Thalassotalea euphylliae]
MREHKKVERLLLFAEVASQLNFTKAAQVLAVSKGYLSAQIKQLEQELATPLLVRTTRSVRLTESGMAVAKQVAEMRQNMLAIDRFTRAESDEISGVLNITAPQQFTLGKLATWCIEFQQQYPAIQIRLDSSYTQYDLMANDFDIAFRATKMPPDNLIAKKLLNYGYICCASPSYLAQHGHLETPCELNDHQCLMGAANEIWQFSSQRITPNKALVINDKAIIREQVIRGAGIAYLPSYFVDSLVQAGDLVALFNKETEQTAASSAIYLLRPQLIRPARKVLSFCEFISAKCSG